MPLPNNIQLYEDIRHHLDRALESPNGIRLNTATSGQAVNLRQRLYKLRALEKERSLEIFEPGDERRAKTAWDNLEIEHTKGDPFLTIVHRAPVTVEDL